MEMNLQNVKENYDIVYFTGQKLRVYMHRIRGWCIMTKN
jgi:hypothetical protein